jgi:hypothetical protein
LAGLRRRSGKKLTPPLTGARAPVRGTPTKPKRRRRKKKFKLIPYRRLFAWAQAALENVPSDAPLPLLDADDERRRVEQGGYFTTALICYKTIADQLADTTVCPMLRLAEGEIDAGDWIGADASMNAIEARLRALVGAGRDTGRRTGTITNPLRKLVAIYLAEHPRASAKDVLVYLKDCGRQEGHPVITDVFPIGRHPRTGRRDFQIDWVDPGGRPRHWRWHTIEKQLARLRPALPR